MQIAVQNDEGKAVGVETDSQCLVEIRNAVIERRDKCLGPDKFDAGLSVGLSHVIAMLAEALEGCDQDRLTSTLYY